MSAGPPEWDLSPMETSDLALALELVSAVVWRGRSSDEVAVAVAAGRDPVSKHLREVARSLRTELAYRESADVEELHEMLDGPAFILGERDELWSSEWVPDWPGDTP